MNTLNKLIHDIEKLEKISDGNIFINILLDEIDSEILKKKICEETKCSLYFYNKQLEKVKEYLKQFNYKKTVSHKPYG